MNHLQRFIVLMSVMVLAVMYHLAPIFGQSTFSLSLDANSAAGDQSVTSVNTSADQAVSIQVFGSNIQNANGFGLRVEYDSSQVTYQGFDAGDVLPGTPTVLARHGTNPTFVEIGIASLSGQATVGSGLVGTIRFRTSSAFSGTSIALARGELSRGGQSENVTLNVRVELQAGSVAPSPDFNGNGTVDVSDFLLFINYFGTSLGDAGYEAKYDLDGSGSVDVSDFLAFVDVFGQTVQTTSGDGDDDGDRAALVALYNAAGGSNWSNNTNWLSDKPLNEWHGVTTNAQGQVVRMGLYENQLSGPIPAELGNLSNLTHLLLGDNQLSGAIPPEIGKLSKLERVELYSNRLSGPIPAELGNLFNLEYLFLFQNQLSGLIPPELGNLSDLEYLDLKSNRLSGSIPSTLGYLANLETLFLQSNQLAGPIPLTLGNLSNLEWLTLGDNLNLCMPAELSGWRFYNTSGVSKCTDPGDRSALVALYNAAGGSSWANNTNWLSDKPLNEWYGVRTNAQGRVVYLSLLAEQLSGSIPSELGNLSELQALYLSDNQLSGSIPSELGNLSNLEDLHLNGNQLSGALPSELGNLSNLEYLNLYDNQLSGSIPSSLGNLSKLEYLSLFDNQLSGSIPSQLGNLSNLQTLHLLINQLSSSIPSSLGNLSKLEVLDLSDNQLSGSIPSSLGNLSNLQTLNLHVNQLSGSIPPELGNLSNLRTLNLAGNQLSGSIPPELGNLSNLQGLGLSGNTNLCMPSSLQNWRFYNSGVKKCE